LNESGAIDLVGTTSNTSFTQPVTFGRKHHSPPYSIFYAFMRGLHPNVIFPRDSQMGVSKLKLLISHNFGRSYVFQIKFFLEMRGKYFVTFKKIFPTAPIGTHLTPVFKEFMIGSLTPFLLIITHANQV
jgi:hypothetical protein